MRFFACLAASTFFGVANYLEAGLWAVTAIGFAIAATRRSGRARRLSCIAAVTFAAFGGSDVLEVQTGAWWRPWWLLAWKTLCVLVLLGLYIVHRRHRARGISLGALQIECGSLDSGGSESQGTVR